MKRKDLKYKTTTTKKKPNKSTYMIFSNMKQ